MEDHQGPMIYQSPEKGLIRKQKVTLPTHLSMARNRGRIVLHWMTIAALCLLGA